VGLSVEMGEANVPVREGSSKSFTLHIFDIRHTHTHTHTHTYTQACACVAAQPSDVVVAFWATFVRTLATVGGCPVAGSFLCVCVCVYVCICVYV
jgi:hypothetical protein